MRGYAVEKHIPPKVSKSAIEKSALSTCQVVTKKDLAELGREKVRAGSHLSEFCGRRNIRHTYLLSIAMKLPKDLMTAQKS